MAGDPEARRALEDVGLADEVDLSSRAHPQRRRRREVPRARREGGRDRPLLPDGAELQTRRSRASPTTEGTIGVARRPVLPLPTGPVPGRDHTQDPELAQAARRGEAAERVYNFLHTLTLEVQMLARPAERRTSLARAEDLCALTMEASRWPRLPLAGTEYIRA